MNELLVCPLVMDSPEGEAVAVFPKRKRAQAEALLKKAIEEAPVTPPGGCILVPMIALELLGWLREQEAQGVRQLVFDAVLSETGSRIVKFLDLHELLASGVAMMWLERLAELPLE